MSRARSDASSSSNPGWAARIGEMPILFPALLGIATLLAIVFALPVIARMPAHISLDYGEGWNGYWTATAMSGAPLYVKGRALTGNNYPPLSFYLNGLVGRWLVGDYIVAGRIVATLSMVAVAGLIARIVRLLGGAGRWAYAAALVFLLYNLVYLQKFAGVDNPQWLGQAFMLGGLLPLLKQNGEGLGWRACFLSDATMILGGLVKHNQFALPISVALWLAGTDRRALLRWLACAIGLAALACAVLAALYGQAIFAELLGFKRTLDPHGLRAGLGKSGCMAALVVVALLGMWRRGSDPRWGVIALYALLGFVLGALQRIGAGVYVNAHDDGLIGLCALCGVFLGTSASGVLPRPAGPQLRAALLLLLLAPILAVSPHHVTKAIGGLEELPATRAQWKLLIADVRDAPGPVYCEVLAACLWAGRPMQIDFFAYGQKLRTGTDPAPLRRLITERRAAMFVLDRAFGEKHGERRLTPDLAALIRANYRQVREVPKKVDELIPATR
ncbi:MAG: hypothetical protein JOY99_00565 [Sphingomonadaceae bacterium]|nr:hypothetical protein [Sphingomonadaceae bacterium]